MALCFVAMKLEFLCLQSVSVFFFFSSRAEWNEAVGFWVGAGGKESMMFAITSVIVPAVMLGLCSRQPRLIISSRWALGGEKPPHSRTDCQGLQLKPVSVPQAV